MVTRRTQAALSLSWASRTQRDADVAYGAVDAAGDVGHDVDVADVVGAGGNWMAPRS